MRIVIVDGDAKAGRKLAAAVEKVVPSVDALLYSEPEEALAGIAHHEPDVVFVAPSAGSVDGADFVRRAVAVHGEAKYVGLVSAPDAEASVRWMSAGAHMVAAQPLDGLSVRTALRGRAEGSGSG